MPAFGKRRALGQHFLRDTSVARLIAETAVAEARRHGCQSLLEIGPGRGAITEPMLEQIRATAPAAAAAAAPLNRIILAERDRDLAGMWRDRIDVSRATSGGAEVAVHEGDFLELPEEHWLGHPPLAVASNLPYSAGTAIVVRLAARPDVIPCMVLMFQAEVAQRLRADPGTKSWGSLSVWIQNRWDVRKLLFVPPSAFAPPPDVNSEVIVLTRRETPWVDTGTDPASLKLWDSLLRMSFAHRRKMLRSGLPPGSIPRKALDVSGVDATKRAEALSWDEWRQLFQACRRV